MYEAFYGFREKPFNLTPDPKFLYLSGKHHEAFAHLEFGLRQRGGFMVVTGEVGTGKTTLCRYFLDRLDQNTLSAFILYPALGATDLLRSVNRDLGVEGTGGTDKDLVDALHRFLLASHESGKSIVLVIDEAQNLSRDVLEQVRLISNLETDTEKLIQIVLIGQSELNDKLAQNDLRQLAQRITARYHLTPLEGRELKQYIRHRLAVAGGIGQVDFTSGAFRAIRRYSKGIPRLINLICDRALLAGYVLERNEIDARTVRRAAKELRLGTSSGVWSRRLARGGLTAAATAAVAGVVFLDPWRDAKSVSVVSQENEKPTPLSSSEINELFEARLMTLSADASRQAASAVLLERWGVRLVGGVAAISQLEEMSALADRAALEYSELETDLMQLRALDMPAVLELKHPSQESSLYTVLTGLDESDAVLYFAPGDFFRVPVHVLLKFWNGRARLFWRDFDALDAADVPSRLAWARGKLEILGMLPEDARESATGLTDAVKSLQRKVHLEADGNVDPNTRMALYSLAGDYRTPRLMTP
ncbi:MAG TPA: AAA family ATPase [Vicinamibacteria bacterium]|nr:AAA family ATPase [Vicinamibacteria bacterium]